MPSLFYEESFLTLVLFFFILGVLFWFRENLRKFYVENPLEAALLLLLGFFPYRVFNLLQLEWNLKLFLSVAIFFLLYSFRKKIIFILLNNFLFQLFFFFGLFIENLVFSSTILAFSMSLWLSYSIFSELFNYFFFFFLCFLILNFYFRFRDLVFNFDLINPELKLEKAEDLNWEKVSLLFSSFLKKHYDLTSVSRLPSRFNNVSFPHVVKRSMFKRAFQHIGENIETWKVIGTGSVGLGAAVGFGVKYKLESDKIDSQEKVKFAEIASQEKVKFAEIASQEKVKFAEIASQEKSKLAEIKAGVVNTIIQKNPKVVSDPNEAKKVTVIFDLLELDKRFESQGKKALSCTQSFTFWDIFF